MVNLPAEEARPLEGQQTEDVDQNGSPSGTATGAQGEHRSTRSPLPSWSWRCKPAASRIEWAFTWPPTITTSSRSSGFEDYNLNFKMLCPKCASAHDYDELDAPER
ncbi:hypothetical protein EVAR_79006_1 [Eumeta japonica]|uniref:Uncharacterized protein n=1 Tax=Eumeta variegata TaxID=151549 RepID=A0A4C1USL7_EUMVA|nr:hypothetical protein EVAR_79006_1 [Eumeta japonica]